MGLCARGWWACAVHRLGSSQSSRREALLVELQELEKEGRRVDEVEALRRNQFHLLMACLQDFQRTVETDTVE